MFKNLQIKSLLLLLVMALGSSVTAWAEDVFYTLTPANGSNNNYASNCDVQIDGITWNITGNSQMLPWRIGGKSITNVDRTVYSKTALEANISKVELIVGAASSITVNSLTLTVAKDADFSNVVETVSATFAANSTITFSPTTENYWEENAYYKFTFNVTVSGSSNKFVEFSEAKFYKAEASGKEKIATIGDLTPTTVEVGTSGTFELPITFADNATANDYSVVWTSSTDNILVLNGSSYTANSAGEAEVTVTVTPINTEAYDAVSKTFTVTVYDPNVSGTENNPYTVEEARAAIDSDEGITGVYAKGVVSEIVTAYNSQYGNISYNISDDGDVDSPQLEIYRGKSYNGANFTSADDIQVGDTVIVKGNLTLYVNQSTQVGTYEFAQNSQLVYLGRPAAAEVAKITVAEPLVELDANEHSGNIAVQYENIDMEAIEVRYVDADGETAQYDWIVAELDPNYGIEYIVVSNNGEARTAYLQVYGLDANAEAVYSNIITITQAKPVVDYATLPFTFDGKLSDIAETAGLTQSGLGSDYKAAPYLKFDTTGDCLVLKLNEAPEVISFDVKGNGFSDGTFTVQTSVDGESYTDLASFTDLADTETKTLINNNANVRFIKWIYTEKVTGNVGLGNISVKKLSATVSAAQWATYVAEANVAFPQGVSAYIVSGTTDTTVELEEVLAVVEGTPVVLNAEAGTYDLEVVAADECDDVANKNRLQVSTANTGNGVYVLANHNNVPGFYKWAGGLLGAGRVYLPAEAAPAGARSFLGFGNGTSTGIEAVENVQTSGSMFDLQGRRVMQPTKGLYIVGGKKVVLK